MAYQSRLQSILGADGAAFRQRAWLEWRADLNHSDMGNRLTRAIEVLADDAAAERRVEADILHHLAEWPEKSLELVSLLSSAEGLLTPASLLDDPPYEHLSTECRVWWKACILDHDRATRNIPMLVERAMAKKAAVDECVAAVSRSISLSIWGVPPLLKVRALQQAVKDLRGAISALPKGFWL